MKTWGDSFVLPPTCPQPAFSDESGGVAAEGWTCENCGPVPGREVTYEETHDTRLGGCGGECR